MQSKVEVREAKRAGSWYTGDGKAIFIRLNV